MLYDFCVSLKDRQKQAIFLFIDTAGVLVAYLFAHLVTATGLGMGAIMDLSVLMPLGAGLSLMFGLHALKLNAFEAQGMTETAMMAGLLTFAGVVFGFAAGTGTPLALYPIFGMAFLISTVSARLALRRAVRRIYDSGKPRDRVLIYGAGQTGQQLAVALRADDAVAPIAFIDDNPTLQSRTLCGLKVFAPSKIGELVERLDIDIVVLAMPSASRPVQAGITRRLRELGCEVQNLPSFADLVVSGSRTSRRNAFEVTELLGRNRLDEEIPGVSETYHARRILVTGAGGSIGSELCRQLITCRPERIVLLDHSEAALYSAERELSELSPRLDIVPVLGSICEDRLVRDVLQREKIDVVFHAAAYKHLPLVEINGIEGMRNNVLGTKTIADAARDAGVERFILVSSDKAVRPTSAMGASKRLAELAIQDLATRSSTTRFSMVRFGNVLGSSGSVIPLFEDQINRGGPITLTHSDVTRYFMTVSEAVRLVLLAGSFARGGDVFVLDMGAPVPIRQLARQMVEGAGLKVRDETNPYGDIDIKVTGLRPGEKLHEELLIGSDMLTTPHPKILRAQESHISEIEMAQLLKGLRAAIDTRDDDAIRKIIAHYIETDQREEAAQVSLV